MPEQLVLTATEAREYFNTKKLPERYSKKSTAKRGKYNNTWTEYNGRMYQSAAEADYSKELDWRKQAGEIKKIEYQVRIELTNEGKHVCNYDLDFLFTDAEKLRTLVEVKGYETAAWKIKWKMIKSQWHKVNADRLILVKRKGKKFVVVEEILK